MNVFSTITLPIKTGEKSYASITVSQKVINEITMLLREENIWEKPENFFRVVSQVIQNGVYTKTQAVGLCTYVRELHRVYA